MSTISPPKYTIHLLPHSHPNPKTWALLLSKQKALRLQSLLDSPSSFYMTYEDEAAFPDSVWEARLANPLGFGFIAAGPPKAQLLDADGSNIIDGEAEEEYLIADWLGCSVLVGPLPHSNDGLEVEKQIMTFELNGLFVSSVARGVGLGEELVNVAIEHGKALAREKGAEEVMMKVSATLGNAKALKLYEKVGFVVTGKDCEEHGRELMRMEMRIALQ